MTGTGLGRKKDEAGIEAGIGIGAGAGTGREGLAGSWPVADSKPSGKMAQEGRRMRRSGWCVEGVVGFDYKDWEGLEFGRAGERKGGTGGKGAKEGGIGGWN